MRTLIATTLLILASGLVGGPLAAADRTSEDLARWLLAPRQATEPLPAALVEYPTPPPAPAIGWAGEYARQFAPESSDTLALLPPPDEDADRVRFAAGAITLDVPKGWSVAEADFPRHVRLYITPESLGDPSSFDEGVWISYHVAPASGDRENRLLSQMRRRAAEATPRGAQRREIESARVDELSALKQPFEISTSEREHAHGFHLLVAADWGVVELHARQASAETARTISRLIDNIAIGRPPAPQAQAAGPIVDARRIIGAWKAERARLVLDADGTIELAYDGERARQIDKVHLTRPTRRLRGNYKAGDDVLYVIWKDGSRLNLRWRSTPGELLLTDHQGRVSQLHRLLE